MPIRAPMPFSLKGAISRRKPWLNHSIINGVERVAERLSGLDWLNRQYAAAPEMGEAEFIRYVLALFKVHYEVDSLERIPETGPVVVVANHPFGAIEGVILAEIMRSRRPDVKILANGLLQRIPELADRLIGVDVFNGAGSRQQNSAPMRQALRWVAQGGALVIFPAGEVAHLKLSSLRVEEPEWQTNIGRLIRATDAPIIPLGISGRNSAIFQLAGLLHPRARTLLLPRELINKRGSHLKIRIGELMNAQHLQDFTDAKSLVDHLRHRTELLRRESPSNPVKGENLPPQ